MDTEKQANPVGRPSKYDPERMPDLAEKFCLLGATDEDLARMFEVHIDTIYAWKVEHPEFSEAIKAGKDEADGQVAKSLFQRAKGYEHDDVDIRVADGAIIETPIVKHYPPDTAAAIFWLKNRQRKNWRDKQEQEIEVHGNMTVETVSYADAAEIPAPGGAHADSSGN